MSLSKKKEVTNSLPKGREKESCQKCVLGKGNELYSQIKDSASAKSKGGYKKAVVWPNEPRPFGFLCM